MEKMTSGTSTAPHRFPVLGVVLTGSNGMFRDSHLELTPTAMLPGCSETDLLYRSASLLAALCADMLIVGKRHPVFASVPVTTPGLGHVAGIATALKAAKGRACLIMACDMPFMNERLLRRLLSFRSLRPPHALMVAYCRRSDGRVEPFAAVYEPGALLFFQHRLQQRRTMVHTVVPADRQVLLPYEPEDERFFFNIHSTEDLERAKRMIGADTLY